MATIIDRLKIKPGMRLLTINEPKDFRERLFTLPADVKVVTTGKVYQQIHWFVLHKRQLEKEVSQVLRLLKEGIIVWVYYPKGSSGLQTDLTRDRGWDCLLSEGEKLTWISLISFDEVWSVFGVRPKTSSEKKREARPKKREIFNWVNAETKKITLPNDLAIALRNNKPAQTFFNSLSFTNKKEYLEWIVTAKRLETRAERVRVSMQKLTASWKNPRNI